MVVQRNVPIRMGDGTILRADVYGPGGGGAHPTLLLRTPYGKATQFTTESCDGARLVEAGFNVVVQDVRGRFHSEGRFQPYAHEASDGVDTIRWIASEPWSDSSVGMFGRSYAGVAQWLAACADDCPGQLRAIAPEAASADFYEGWAYQRGAFHLGFCLPWVLEDFLSRSPDQSWESQTARRRNAQAALLGSYWEPLVQADRSAPFYREWLEHPGEDDYWKKMSVRHRLRSLNVPAFVVGGWHDVLLSCAIQDFASVQEADNPLVRNESKLLVGPWSHLSRTGKFTHCDFGECGIVDLTKVYIDWFRGRFLGIRPTPAPRVRLFMTGPDNWHSFDIWPPPATHHLRLWLQSGGHANTQSGNGVLAVEPAEDGQPADEYSYNPQNPVPTVPFAMLTSQDWMEFGPWDRNEVELRPDVLCYTSAPLETAIAVVGNGIVTLYASTSTVDTDFVATLVNVGLDGRAMSVADAIVRASYRNSTPERQLVKPEAIHRYELLLGPMAIVFGKGHRIRLEITSSNYPRFDKNANDGGPATSLGVRLGMVSRVIIWHGALLESILVLPVIPPEAID